jgi:hypothetical protein
MMSAELKHFRNQRFALVFEVFAPRSLLVIAARSRFSALADQYPHCSSKNTEV